MLQNMGVHETLNNTVDTMKENAGKLAERDVNLEHLDNKTRQLTQDTKSFKKESTKVRDAAKRRNICVSLYLACGAITLTGLIVAPISKFMVHMIATELLRTDLQCSSYFKGPRQVSRIQHYGANSSLVPAQDLSLLVVSGWFKRAPHVTN